MAEKKYEPLTKCLCTNTWINYIKDQGWSTDGLYEGIDYSEEYMCDVENWIPTDQVQKLASNITCKISEDPNLFYKMAFWAAKNRTAGAIQTIAKSFISPGFIYDRLPKYIENFNKHRKIEIVERSTNRAVLNTYHMLPETPAIRETCEWTRGLIAVAPFVLGLPTADVKETLCEVNGDKCCQYEVIWTNRKNIFATLWEKTFSQKKIVEEQRIELERSQEKLLERFEELKKAKNTIEDYAKNLEIKVEQRTQELRDTQSKLLEAEKRTLEHRITGGFAHEMRNALSGAQLEFKTILNYKDKGKPSAQILKESATSLLKNITLIHEKYGIPRGEIATDFIPELKSIAEIADHLSGVHSGVSSDLDRGLSITIQIRDYAKMSEMKPGDTPVDIVALLKEYTDRYRQDFERIGINYSVEGIGNAIVKADEIHINSIFSNLILNAKDALEEQGGESKEIRVTVEGKDDEDNSYFIIKVQDNGPGIPKDHLSEIFEPFFSTKPTSGTGLGLGVVRRLVQLYEGQIEVKSKEGEGAIFTVTLPCNILATPVPSSGATGQADAHRPTQTFYPSESLG